MNIIELAKQAGFKDPAPADGYMGLAYDYSDGTDSGADLTRFAALVRAAALAEQPTKQPLTDEQICDALEIDGADDWTFTVARAIERAHGIGETK